MTSMRGFAFLGLSLVLPALAFVQITPNEGQTLTLAAISGSGTIQHILITPAGDWRLSILRMYWDGETDSSVEGHRRRLLRAGLGQIRTHLISCRLGDPRERSSVAFWYQTEPPTPFPKLSDKDRLSINDRRRT